MRQHVFRFIMIVVVMGVLGALDLSAQIKGNNIVVTVTPDHQDWNYRVGEKANFTVNVRKSGTLLDHVKIDYEAGPVMFPDVKKSTTLKDGMMKWSGSLNRPGFYRFKVVAHVDGKDYEGLCTAGFSPEKIQPYAQEPKDFDAFWQQAKDELKNVPLSYTKELAKEYCTDKIDCYLVKLQIDKMGHSMYGYLFYPKNAKQGTHPVVLCPPGAGIKTIKEPLRNKYYAENGFVRLEIEIHGLDPRMPADKFKEISNAFNDANGGYLANGLENKDIYYMKHVYLGLVRCIDFLTSLPEWDGKNVAVQGGSQGGALAIVAAGLDKRITQCVANHPALSDMAGYIEKGRTGGYPHFCKQPEILGNKDCLNTMAYFDVVNFARYVSAPTYLTWGYNDVTCPPTTSYAVWNTLKCKKESLLTPINEHWTTPETNYKQMEWIKAHLVK